MMYEPNDFGAAKFTVEKKGFKHSIECYGTIKARQYYHRGC